MAGYVRKGPEEPPQWECARGRGVLGGSPHPPHPAGQEAPNLLEEEAERMKQKPESHEGRATRRGRGYTVGYIHSLTTRCRLKSLIASTCCPREMRRSEGRGAAGGGALLPRRNPESHIATREPQISQPVCTLQPHVFCPPSSYLTPRAPPFSTLSRPPPFLITGSSSPAACRGGARNYSLSANRHLPGSLLAEPL